MNFKQWFEQNDIVPGPQVTDQNTKMRLDSAKKLVNNYAKNPQAANNFANLAQAKGPNKTKLVAQVATDILKSSGARQPTVPGQQVSMQDITAALDPQIKQLNKTTTL